MSTGLRVTVLTGPASGAIATVEVSGARAWELARLLFRPAGDPLPETAEPHRFWLGKIGTDVADEVILAVTAVEPGTRVEVHCHGGRRVVRWLVEQFVSNGCTEVLAELDETDPWRLLTQAPTPRTASILLDQAQGAFARAVRGILDTMTADRATALKLLQELAGFAEIGRHLVEPWNVVIAGPPNVGKSSLVNALAGYQRAIVSDIAGTTRDVVTVPVAFDGWPMLLSDTAGLRLAAGLEAEGIARAKERLREADLVIWILDGSLSDQTFPDEETTRPVRLPPGDWLMVLNKVDLMRGELVGHQAGALPVSAVSAVGIPTLMEAIVSRLVPHTPKKGAAVPFTPRLADAIVEAEESMRQNRLEEARRLLLAILEHACCQEGQNSHTENDAIDNKDIRGIFLQKPQQRLDHEIADHA